MICGRGEVHMDLMLSIKMTFVLRKIEDIVCLTNVFLYFAQDLTFRKLQKKKRYSVSDFEKEVFF